MASRSGCEEQQIRATVAAHRRASSSFPVYPFPFDPLSRRDAGAPRTATGISRVLSASAHCRQAWWRGVQPASFRMRARRSRRVCRNRAEPTVLPGYERERVLAAGCSRGARGTGPAATAAAAATVAAAVVVAAVAVAAVPDSAGRTVDSS